ncbi:DUF4190 domain-containing protein [Glycomyces sp. NRRL B-16210]|uniref:DUF4190 domain-containing protein n=1 Tax=Glycomyces sp. NRRL B-16210 TaxID=1463821 RepID=UPI0006917E5B|nr:DUF4190 domain-containing protein [Glycomyces sp. NRRL B-16210]
MTYPPNPDQSGQGGFQYDPYGSQPGSQPPIPGGSPQPQQPGYGQPSSQPPAYGAAPQLPPAAPGYPPPYGAPGPYAPQPPKGLAVASMVLGIIAAALFCVPYVNFICGILAAIMGGVGLKKANTGQGGGKGMAVAGLVLGIIVCSWFALWIILWISGVASMSAGTSGF